MQYILTTNDNPVSFLTPNTKYKVKPFYRTGNGYPDFSLLLENVSEQIDECDLYSFLEED